MKVPITQSAAWAKLQADLGEKSFLEQGKDFQYLAILKKTPTGNYLYCPYGPIAKDKTSFKQALKSLQALAQKQSAIFIRIEPYDAKMAQILPSNAKKTKDLNPKETWLLDLTGNDDALKAKLPSRLLRYYKAAAKKGITIETSHDPKDIHYLLDLQKALAHEKGISTFSENYLQTELQQPFATLYLIKYNDGLSENESFSTVHGVHKKSGPEGPVESIVAAGLVFDDQDTRYNLQGAQTDLGRKLHATGILTIQLILDAKAKGQKTFDFWGIAPEGANSTHPWAGFTAFKKTFAGYQEDRAGTYDLILNPAKYRLYQIMRKLNRLRRKS